MTTSDIPNTSKDPLQDLTSIVLDTQTEMQAQFDQVETKFSQIDARFEQMKFRMA
jgi:hypothetical protein